MTTISPLAETDIDDQYAAIERSRTLLSPFAVWLNDDYDYAKSAEWVSEAVANAEAGREHHFAIRAEDGSFAGMVGLNAVDTANRTAEIGYWVAIDRIGCGHATRAAGLLIDWASQTLGIERFELMIRIDNARSVAVARRIGASREATLSRRLRDRDGNAYDAGLWVVLRPDC